MALLQRFSFMFCLLAFLSISLQAQPYYVSTIGDDATGTGTIDLPYKTITKAVSMVAAGDTIYVRGGTYTFTGSSNAITLPAISGTSATVHCNLIGYNGERVLLDFSPMTGTSAFGLYITGSYWYIKGFDCKGAPKNGIKLSGGSYNTIEFCTSFENRDTGVQLSAGASYNRFINCDSYYNFDSPSGGNADGFSPKLDVGTGNYFYGCRSWQNSDDGWDGYMRPSDNVTDTLENCWTFMNGYLKNGNPILTGNGNGFKMGGGDTSNKDSLRHNMILKNCLSFDNRVKGFDQNNNRGSMTLFNCTGYRNGTYNFSVPGKIRVTETLTIKNCISLASTGVNLGGVPNPIFATNSWPDISTYPTAVTSATSADFISVDTAGVRGPRKADGSLPDITFMHLAQGSLLIDAGTNVGLPFNGTAPDLGFFESDYSTSVQEEMASRISGFQLLQNYPNPFNPSTVIRFSVAKAGVAKLHVINILGQQVATLFSEHAEPGKIYPIQFDAASMPSGVYFSILESNGKQETKKMILMK